MEAYTTIGIPQRSPTYFKTNVPNFMAYWGEFPHALGPRQRIAAIKKHCRTNPQTLLRPCYGCSFNNQVGFLGFLGGLPGETHTRKSPSTMLRLPSKDSSSALPWHSMKKHYYSTFCLNRVGDQTFVLSWLHSSLRRSSHLNMHKRARIHERGGLEGMTLGSTNLVGKAIQDGQRG